MSTPPIGRKSFVGQLFLVAGIFCGIAFLAFLIKERSFYFLSYESRALHPQFENLKSSGFYGLSFGIIGTALMFLNLGYLVRRQWLDASWLGPLRHWMSFHVFTGFVGGGLVLLHSSFQLRSTMGSIAFYALAIVILTGIVGRYIYSRVPRSLEGKELELEDIRVEVDNYKRKFTQLGFQHPLLSEEPKTSITYHNFFVSFFLILFGDPAVRREFSSLRDAVLQNPRLRGAAPTLLPLTKRYCQIHQWFIRYDELRSFMSSWRFFHRWFAILMLITILFHIGLSLVMGDLWIFKH